MKPARPFTVFLVTGLSLSTCGPVSARSAGQRLLSAGPEHVSVRSNRSVADTPSSSAILGLLPAGEMKRRFILDCTGCHQMDMERTFPEGRARTAAEWEGSIRKMLSMAGPGTQFPVISAEQDAVATARWLAEYLTRPPAPARSQAGTTTAVREFDYPYPGDLPHDLIVDAEGRVVITGMFTHRVLRLDPVTGEYDEFPIPVQQANPRALEIDGEGNWWVLLGAPHAVARYDPDAGEWSHWSIGLYGHSIRLDGSGRAWFNGHFTADPPIIGYVEPATGAIRTFEVPLDPAPQARNPVPYGLRVAPDGSLYGTELQGNRLVRLDPEKGQVDVWRLPTSHSGPRRLDVASDGTVWVPQYAANRIARFDPASETFTEHTLPVSDALPYIVRLDQRGRVLVGTAAADAVLRFDPARGAWEVFALPTRGVLIRHMDVDSRTGDLWMAYGASPGIPAKITRVGLGDG